MWVDTTFCQFITSSQFLAILHLNSGSIRDQIGLGYTFLVICHGNLAFLLVILNNSYTFNFGNNRKTFGLSCFKKLLDTGKTLCDISTSNTSGMEGTHGQLCTRLTDRLSCDDSDRFTNLNSFTGCHVGTITLRTNTDMRLT